MPDTIHIDREHPECCALSAADHVRESLGSPLELPDVLQSILCEHWASSDEAEPNLLQLFKLITGATYQQVARDNTFNGENDLDTFFVWTVYADTACPDWVWRRDVFVAVEMGFGGDPRYSAYGPAQIFRLEDVCLGDTGFLDVVLGWWATPIDERYDPQLIDSQTDRIGLGYSSHPYYELERMLYAAPIWSERHKAFLGRFRNTPYPVKLLPYAPHYGG